MITGHCTKCLGSGTKKINTGIVFELIPCEFCRGLGGVVMKEGSGEHRVAAAIGTMRKKMDIQRDWQESEDFNRDDDDGRK